jgi:DNA-nicking Smr family endonuclease
LSHKIKLNFKNKTKSLEDLPNQKISIALSKTIAKTDNFKSEKNIKTDVVTNNTKPVTIDQQLHKQFKKSDFSKIDLHGFTVDEAHQKLLKYLINHFSKKNLLHIVITGLGNKSSDGDFFTGKIRKQFPLWLETEIFQKYVKSYCPCKIQHGGLGAFYIKLKSKV